LVGLEPYPISTVETDSEDYVAGLVVSKLPANSAVVVVRAAGMQDENRIAVISGWNLERGKGALVMLVRGETTQRSIARFVPSIAQCTGADARECIDRQVVLAKGSVFSAGDAFHIEVLGTQVKPADSTLLLATSDTEYTLELKDIKTARAHRRTRRRPRRAAPCAGDRP
jgi:hypothetical protein